MRSCLLRTRKGCDILGKCQWSHQQVANNAKGYINYRVGGVIWGAGVPRNPENECLARTCAFLFVGKSGVGQNPSKRLELHPRAQMSICSLAHIDLSSSSSCGRVSWVTFCVTVSLIENRNSKSIGSRLRSSLMFQLHYDYVSCSGTMGELFDFFEFITCESYTVFTAQGHEKI